MLFIFQAKLTASHLKINNIQNKLNFEIMVIERWALAWNDDQCNDIDFVEISWIFLMQDVFFIGTGHLRECPTILLWLLSAILAHVSFLGYFRPVWCWPHVQLGWSCSVDRWRNRGTTRTVPMAGQCTCAQLSVYTHNNQVYMKHFVMESNRPKCVTNILEVSAVSCLGWFCIYYKGC